MCVCVVERPRSGFSFDSLDGLIFLFYFLLNSINFDFDRELFLNLKASSASVLAIKSEKTFWADLQRNFNARVSIKL